jgi:hypothetical protein
MVIADNLEAFAARYPGRTNVMGPFTGDLADEGERILLVGKNGETLLEFTYQNTWYSDTNGAGFTLVTYDPLAPLAAFSTPANWRQSDATGGSPGANEPNRAPTVDVGFDVVAPLPRVTLSPTVSDDRLPDPPGALTIAWTKVSGPGTVTFGSPNAANTTADFSLPGNYVLRLTANDTTVSTSDDLLVSAKDTPAAWLARHPTVGPLENDFEGDGLTNAFEMALVLDPTVPDAQAGLRVDVVDGHLTLTYQRQKPPASVTYSVEVTNDLSSWPVPGPGDVTEEILSDDGVVQRVKATDATPISAANKRFIRLRITY